MNESSFLQKPRGDTQYAYKKVILPTSVYNVLKSNGGQYDAYLGTEHIGLAMQWMLKNPTSSSTESFEIVQNDLLSLVMPFYDCMMSKEGFVTCYKNAYAIHKFP